MRREQSLGFRKFKSTRSSILEIVADDYGLHTLHHGFHGKIRLNGDYAAAFVSPLPTSLIFRGRLRVFGTKTARLFRARRSLENEIIKINAMLRNDSACMMKTGAYRPYWRGITWQTRKSIRRYPRLPAR